MMAALFIVNMKMLLCTGSGGQDFSIALPFLPLVVPLRTCQATAVAARGLADMMDKRAAYVHVIALRESPRGRVD